ECLHPGPVNALHSALIPTGPFGLGNPLSLALATHIGLESCEDSEHAEEGATSGGRSVHVLFEYLERGDHSTLWNAAATIRFQHDLQQVHHVIIVDSLRHLGQQPVVPNVVKVAPQIKILFRGFHGSLICYGLPGCSAPCTDLTGFPAIGAFYFQASNGLVALPVAGYDYSIDWTPMLAGLPPAGMAARLAARHPPPRSRVRCRATRGRPRRRMREQAPRGHRRQCCRRQPCCKPRGSPTRHRA